MEQWFEGLEAYQRTGGNMQVGDLVKMKPKYGCNRIGIIVLCNTGGRWVQWSCGDLGFMNPSDMEVICK